MAYIGSSPTKVVSRQSANIFTYTATANQTVFTGSDANGNTLACTPSDIMVHMNGIKLEESDYTASTTTVTLGSGAAAGDEVTITAFVTFETADAYTKSAADTRYVNTTGDTMTGALTVDAAAATPLTVDRASSFGTIIDVQKDGSSVGAVGSPYGGELYIQGTGANSSGLLFTSGNTIQPRKNSAADDGNISIGASGNKFKDLYLSGGAYIGGTTSANHLDDYETGSFQMTMTGISTTSAVGYGIYAKVGNLCHFSWYSGTQTVTSAVVPVLGGLPFTSISPYGSGGAYAAVTFAHNTYASNVASGYINIGTTSIYLTANNSSGGASVTTGSKYVMCSGTYYVA